MTTKTRLTLLSLYQSRTGSTTHIPVAMDNPGKLSQYFRDRTDVSTVSDIRRWR